MALVARVFNHGHMVDLVEGRRSLMTTIVTQPKRFYSRASSIVKRRRPDTVWPLSHRAHYAAEECVSTSNG